MASTAEPAERKYRPTYTVVPKQSRPSNFGAPAVPPKDLPSVHECKRQHVRKVSQGEVGEVKVHNRRHSNLRNSFAVGQNTDLRSAPTVATSGITASASTNDLSFPRKALRMRASMGPTTRIPTPIARKPDEESSTLTIPKLDKRKFSIESIPEDDGLHNNAPSVKEDSRSTSQSYEYGTPARQHSTTGLPPLSSENSQESRQSPAGSIAKIQRLLGPIEPSSLRQRSNLPRAKTMQVLSNIGSTFGLIRTTSRFSTANHNSSNSPRSFTDPARRVSFMSINLTRNKGKELELADIVDENVDIFSVTKPMPPSYWAGRYSSLNDRFHAEVLAPGHFISGELYFTLKTAEEEQEDTYSDHLSGDDIRRSLRVFQVLRESCKTESARRSLKSFQEGYARKLGAVMLLPPGSTMEEKESVLQRVSNVSGRFFRRKSSGLSSLSTVSSASKASSNLAAAAAAAALQDHTNVKGCDYDSGAATDTSGGKSLRSKRKVKIDAAKLSIGQPTLIPRKSMIENEDVKKSLEKMHFDRETQGARLGDGASW